MSSNQFPCDKCGFALTQLNPSQNITLKCKCKEQTINYYEYLNIVKVHPLNKEIKCENHNKAFSFFCTLCERHICGLCEVKSEDKKIIMKEHIKKNHCKECIDEDEIFQSDSCQNCKKFEMYIIDISKNFSIEKHLTKLNSIAHHIKDYIYKLKKKVIQRLVNEINQIESYYETISNTNYIQIMKSIINEYNTKYPNYYVINNIRNNCNLCNINISTCSKEEDTNEKKIEEIKDKDILSIDTHKEEEINAKDSYCSIRIQFPKFSSPLIYSQNCTQAYRNYLEIKNKNQYLRSCDDFEEIRKLYGNSQKDIDPLVDNFEENDLISEETILSANNSVFDRPTYNEPTDK